MLEVSRGRGIARISEKGGAMIMTYACASGNVDHTYYYQC